MILKNILLLTALSCSIAFSSCKNMQDPEYRDIKNFRLTKLNTEESTAKMDVVYYNPNSLNFQIRSTDLDIYINNNYVGHTNLDSVIRVPKQTEFIIPVSARVNTQTFFSNALSALLTKEVNIRITGSIKAGASGLYKNFKVNYEGKQAIKF
ncbi:MAG: LEA type 2 family protein [Sphingobacteriales bacterium]|nr:LEA type 2 family protein [Sphingobacteriales bacterium]MBI3718697.1 LEA type 2 family protein [Sphingobacteriales bacterium]